MMAQAPLDQAGDEISDAVARGGYQGFTSLSVHIDSHSVTLRWKGTVPAGLEPTISTIRQRGIGVTVAAAKHSLAELQQQAQSLIAQERADNVPVEYRAVTASPLPDGSGLEVGVPRLDASETMATMKIRSRFPVVRTVASAGDVPLTRQADTAPFWGGARVMIGRDNRRNPCTTGFGVAWGGNRKFILSAAHCGLAADTVRNGAGTIIGNVAGRVSAIENSDTMLINVSQSGASVYDGAWNDASGYAKPVVGRASNYVNDYVCTSGSFSGVRCSIQVTNPNATEQIGGFTVTGVVQGRRTDGTNAAGSGDSGGPVFALSSNVNQVIAKGIISTGVTRTEVPCTGVGSSAIRKCYSTINWIPINKALADFGATLNLG